MDKKILNKIPGYFKIEKYRQDSRMVIFLTCLAISAVLWFLNAMNKDYTTHIQYPVRFIKAPKNQFLANDLPEEFTLKVNAHGFTLLRHKLHLSFTPIVLNINNITRDNPTSGNQVHTIYTSTLLNRISQQISNEIKISDIQPASFIIILDSLKTKNVPIAADIDLEFKPHYSLTSPISIQPGMATIKGPGAIIKNIDTIFTENKVFKDVGQQIKKELELVEPAKTTISPKNIMVTIPVSEFTEKVINPHVYVAGKPDSVKVKLFPSTLKVSFMIGLDKFSEVTGNNFRFTVPYAHILEGKPSVPVTLEKVPPYILDLKYSPQTLEYLIEKD